MLLQTNSGDCATFVIGGGKIGRSKQFMSTNSL